MPIVLSKRTKKQKIGHGLYEVPTEHGRFGADGKFLGATTPQSTPLAQSLVRKIMVIVRLQGTLLDFKDE